MNVYGIMITKFMNVKLVIIAMKINALVPMEKLTLIARSVSNVEVLDLCAGFGGFSEAFHKSPHWEVMRIDNNPLLAGVENMEIIDIFEFRDHLHNMVERGYCPDHVDLIVAAPP